MSTVLRIILLLAGIVCAGWIFVRIRRSKVKVEDAVFWFCLAGVMLVFGFFPKISYWFSDLLGIQSPANFIFLFIIAMLIEKTFTLSIKVSQIEEKIEILAAETAIRTKDLEDRNTLEYIENGINKE